MRRHESQTVSYQQQSSEASDQLRHCAELYLPQWDGLGEWRVEVRQLRGRYFAYPDLAEHIMYVQPDVDLCACCFIHLLAHAASGSGEHDAAWRQQMLVAARNANDRGDDDLCEALLCHVLDEFGTEGPPAWVIG